MLNIDNYLEEHLADKAAKEAEEKRLADEKREAERVEYNRVEQQARVIVNRRHSVYLRRIEAQCLGFVTDVNEDKATLTLNGVEVQNQISFNEDRTSISSWRSKPNGKTSIVIGDYGDRTRFPMHKDGSHNYVDIARLLTRYAEGKLIEARAQAQRAKNSPAVQALQQEFNLPQYSGLVAQSSRASKDVHIDLTKLNTTGIWLSTDDARKFLLALRSYGIKLGSNG